MKVMVAQINPTVGDLAGNLNIIKQGVLNAISAGCDVVLFPELATVGYPPRDLLYSKKIWDNHKVLIDRLEAFILQQNCQITVIVGGLHEVMLSGGCYARYNAAWILDKHFGRRVVHKRLLPCYDVFDESRYFTPAIDEPYAPIKLYIEHKDGNYETMCDILICEDIWNNEFCGGEEWMKPATYTIDPVANVALYGRGPLFVLNGSPFWIGKIAATEKLVTRISDRIKRPVIWCNQVGAHDDIITGGYSMVKLLRSPGILIAKAFEEDALIVSLGDSQDFEDESFNNGQQRSSPVVVQQNGSHKEIGHKDFDCWSIYKALFLHMTDYKKRCGFNKAVIGISGGIDSAVVTVIAAHVFGKENVTGISMPSKFSSEGSIEDAKRLAVNLGIHFEMKPINDIYDAIRDEFLSGGRQTFSSPLTDENIQPRCRANLLMVHSNDNGSLLLTTGNKSEISVGYCTLYGDTCGGLAVISDLWKTQVYELARFLNKYFGNPIPQATIEKPASAELKPDQKDTDSLPPYEILDPILRMFVEQEMDIAETVECIQKNKDLVKQLDGRIFVTVSSMNAKYKSAEFKRQQMPVGPKLQKRSFGSGRRMPIAMKTSFVG